MRILLYLLLAPLFVFAQGEQRYADGTATDQDGNAFEWINYGTQDWSIENAEIVTYRDGTEIPQVTNDGIWTDLTTGAWCYFDNDPSKGKLYNAYAIIGRHDNDENTPNKEFAPQGWHVPSNSEWGTLQSYLIVNRYNYDQTNTGNKIALSMTSTTGWNPSEIQGSPGYDQSIGNKSGFNAPPDGLKNPLGDFQDEGLYAAWWSHVDYSLSSLFYITITNASINLSRNPSDVPSYGNSVRFVRDAVDTEPPVITLLGDNPISVNQGDTYTDQGATATDNVDGNLTANITVTSNVDTSTVGTYTVTYNVSDAAGNAATEVVRTVNVVQASSNDETVIAVWDFTENALGVTEFNSDFSTLNGSDTVSNTTLGFFNVSTDQVGDGYDNARTLNHSSGFPGPFMKPLELTPSDLVDNKLHMSISFNSITMAAGMQFKMFLRDSNSSNINSQVQRAIGIYLGQVDGVIQIKKAGPNNSFLGAVEIIGDLGATYDQSITLGVTLDWDAKTTDFWIGQPGGSDGLQNAANLSNAWTDTQGNAIDAAGYILDDLLFQVDLEDSSLEVDQIKFSTGSYQNTVAAGNADTEDTEAPVITLIGESTVSINQDATYSDQGATATDNVDGDISANITATSNVDTSTVGTYTVTYNVSDAAGNAATEVVRTVNVVDTVDTEAPVLTLNGANPFSLNIGDTYTDAGATATDNVDGDITANITVTSNVDTSTVGTYTVTYNVSDAAGNAATPLVRVITVNPVEINPSETGILLNGTVSAENNQIKNVADPTDAQDAVTKTFIENFIKNSVSMEFFEWNIFKVNTDNQTIQLSSKAFVFVNAANTTIILPDESQVSEMDVFYIYSLRGTNNAPIEDCAITFTSNSHPISSYKLGDGLITASVGQKIYGRFPSSGLKTIVFIDGQWFIGNFSPYSILD